MSLIRYATDGEVAIGRQDDAGHVYRLPWSSIAELLRLPASEFADALRPTGTVTEQSAIRLLPPVDGLTEVWAAGVTYERSSAARQEESVVADVYARVYDAARPELFFKSVAWRVVGPDEPVGVRDDSTVDVAEPELALVVNAFGDIVGYTICNDVSSRSIEGDNPLYLPQAKIYSGSCALGPAVVPVADVADCYNLGIDVAVRRGAEVVWQARTSTALLHRRFDDLVAQLRRNLSFPDGVVLSTGTGLVPGLDLTLEPGDVVSIGIDGLGTLTNPVVDADPTDFGWLSPEPGRRPVRGAR